MQKNIVLVDENSDALLIKSKILNKVYPNYGVINYCDKGKALQYLVEYDITSTLSLILLDVSKAPLEAWRFVEEIVKRKKNLNVPIVMIGDSSDNIEIKKIYSYKQVKGFLVKPFNVSSLDKFL